LTPLGPTYNAHFKPIIFNAKMTMKGEKMFKVSKKKKDLKLAQNRPKKKPNKKRLVESG
jgi:hypothetical protein